VLCLAVQGILLAGFLIDLLTNQVNAQLFSGWADVKYNYLLLAYLLPVLLWLIFKPFLYNAKADEEVKYSFRRFKNNPEVFSSLALRQTAQQHNADGLGLVFGNPAAENLLIKVCNPYCGPCAKSFPDLEELVHVNGENWKAQIIFTATPNIEDQKALPVAHFLTIDDQENKEATLKALGDWYNADKKDYAAYSKMYPLKVDFEQQAKRLAKMDEWCRAENIQFTPTYFVNGRMLPENYSIEDLKDIA
jgi:hypothetical protein